MCRPNVNPKNSLIRLIKGPRIRPKSNVKVEENLETKGFSPIWVETKTVFGPDSKHQNRDIGQTRAQKDFKVRPKLITKVEENH